MTVNILSDKIGTSRYALMDYENGITEPDLDVLKTIAAVLEINHAELYDEYYSFLDHPYSVFVKQIRQKIGATQKQFGALFGVGRRTVERWEAGRNKVGRKVYEQMKKLGLL